SGGFDLMQAGFSAVVPVVGHAGAVVRFAGLESFPAEWFQRGRLTVQTGRAAGLVGLVKVDRVVGAERSMELWAGVGVDLAVGDVVKLEAGCDKTAATCRGKFSNFLNFRGFPLIPGDDWLASYPVSSQPNDGGSLVK
ncbi:MAG: phage BR0599 family protein, partial [Paracoccaceae bacterium]